MGLRLIALSLVLLMFSVIILNTKGYFLVRGYFVEGREDVEKFLDSSYNQQSYVFLDREAIEESVKANFSDVQSVNVRRGFNLEVNVTLKELTPVGRSNDGKLISDSGILYTSAVKSPENLVTFNVGNLQPKLVILSLDQVYFIQSINEEYKISEVEIIKPFHFVINLYGVSIEVEKDYSSLPSMLDAVSKYIAGINVESGFSKLIIVDNRIIIVD